MLSEARSISRPIITATPSLRRVREVGDTFHWFETSPFRKHFKLKGTREKDLVGFLKWRKECGSLALGETAAGRWTFKRNGFLKPFVTIRPVGGETTGHLWISPNGEGCFQPSPGREYRWKCTNFWKNEWSWFQDHKRLMKIEAVANFNNKVGRMTAAMDRLDDETLSQLLLAGWYVMVLMQEESATEPASTPF
ncbi:MAG: hypothetical protein WBA12_11980 [Catalinimonas sp.]